MTFDPTSVEVLCVTLPKDHCVQVPWKYIKVCGYSDLFCQKNLNQRSLTPRWPLTPHLLRSHVWLYPRIILSKSHENTSKYVDTVNLFAKTWTKGHWPLDDLWPHICWGHMCDCAQGSLCPSPMGIRQCMWIQLSILQKLPHTYIHILRTYYILHTTYRISDHIVSFWTTFRRDNKVAMTFNFFPCLWQISLYRQKKKKCWTNTPPPAQSYTWHIKAFKQNHFQFLYLPEVMAVWRKICYKSISALRGYCTPGQFLDCFCIFLKNYSTLVTSKICFL